MRTHYDIMIIGAGSMGASTAYQLAREGCKVLMIDAYDPPHNHGSHHGDTRIFRHAYSSDPTYVQLALLADQHWLELEQRTSTALLHRTGVINIYPADSPDYLGKKRNAEQFNLQVTSMDACEIRKQWPGIQLPDHCNGLYEHHAGILYSELCVRSYRALAEQYGAVTRVNSPVHQIDISAREVAVHLGGTKYTADKLLITAGAQSRNILTELNLPVIRIRKTIAWFSSEQTLYSSESFPAFTFETEQGEYYGFPSIDGSGVKVGRHDGGQTAIPGNLLLPFGSYPEDEAELRSFIKACLPQASGPLLRGEVCSYGRTPDEDFIIDRHPEHEHIFIATGFSGHGFKFTSAIGVVMRDWMTKGSTDYDLSAFTLSRFN